MSRKRSRQRKKLDARLANIVADVVARRRDGQSPCMDDYSCEDPDLTDALRRRLQVIDYLEAFRGELNTAEAAPQCDFATAVAELSGRAQLLVYLRLVKRHPWKEISLEVPGTEELLKQEHAAAVRQIMERCHHWLAEHGAASAKAE